MSNLDNLINSIMNDYEEKARAIRDAAQAEADGVIRKKTEEGQAEAARIVKDGEAETGRAAERILVGGRLGQRDALLAAKRSVMDQVFHKALETLNAMELDAFLSYLRDGLRGLSGGGELILPAKFGVTAEELTPWLKDWGVKGVTLYSGDRQVTGGFILLQNGIEHNRTFEALLDYSRGALEAEVAPVLFDPAGAVS